MLLGHQVTRDGIILPSDLDHLAEWEQKWKMEFHLNKCEVIHISHKRNIIKHEYNLHGHILKAVTAAKYLGVTITSDLKWNRHIDSAATKANRVLGFKSSSLKEKAYKTLVRSQWSTQLPCGIRKTTSIGLKWSREEQHITH